MAFEGPRSARPEELPEVIDLVDTVFRTGRGLMATMGPEYPLHLAPENASNLWIMLDNGRPICHYGVTRSTWLTAGCRIPIAAVGAVATAPDYRGQGLATRAMQACEENLQSQGVVLEFISGTRGLYRRNNAVPAGETRLLSIDFDSPQNTPTGTANQSRAYSLRPWTETDFGWLQHTYWLEPVRYLRTPAEWRKLLERDTLSTSRTRQVTLIVEDALKTRVAYIVSNTIQPTSDHNLPPGSMTIVEYAGSRSAVAAAFDLLGPTAGQLRLQIPAWDTALISLLQHQGHAAVASTVRGHTIKILNFPVLVDALAEHFYEAGGVPEGSIRGLLGANGEMIFAGLAEQIAVADQEQLVKLLFGAPDTEPPGNLNESRLGRVLQAALPVPVPIPGLNYT